MPPSKTTEGQQALSSDMRRVEGRELREGDRITFLDVHRTCNACWYCLVARASTRCPQRKVYGITYGLDDGLCGGWADQIYLKPGTLCIQLKADAETFMAGGCALPTSLHAVERGDIAIGDTVLLLGSGPVGINAIILALMRGALRVLCIGAPEHRLESATEAGASDILNFEAHDESERLQWVREPMVAAPTSPLKQRAPATPSFRRCASRAMAAAWLWSANTPIMARLHLTHILI